jgi:hypothetical protein
VLETFTLPEGGFEGRTLAALLAHFCESLGSVSCANVSATFGMGGPGRFRHIAAGDMHRQRLGHRKRKVKYVMFRNLQFLGWGRFLEHPMYCRGHPPGILLHGRTLTLASSAQHDATPKEVLTRAAPFSRTPDTAVATGALGEALV